MREYPTDLTDLPADVSVRRTVWRRKQLRKREELGIEAPNVTESRTGDIERWTESSRRDPTASVKGRGQWGLTCALGDLG